MVGSSYTARQALMNLKTDFVVLTLCSTGRVVMSVFTHLTQRCTYSPSRMEPKGSPGFCLQKPDGTDSKLLKVFIGFA